MFLCSGSEKLVNLSGVFSVSAVDEMLPVQYHCQPGVFNVLHVVIIIIIKLLFTMPSNSRSPSTGALVRSKRSDTRPHTGAMLIRIKKDRGEDSAQNLRAQQREVSLHVLSQQQCSAFTEQ